MYWLPKMPKIPIGAKFIVASKSYSTKPLFDVISQVFKMIFNLLKVFLETVFFLLTCFKKFWLQKIHPQL